MKDFFRKYHRFAVVGLSRDPKSFSRGACKFLIDQGCELVAVNPREENIAGIVSMPSLDLIPEVDGAIFFTNPRVTVTLLPQCLDQGIKKVWFQQGSADEAVLKLAQQLGLSYVNSCVFLHHPRAGFPHNVHRAVARVFKLDNTL
ncbi:MAG TPA: hypothetical protein DER60_14125 [Syntrophomonas sp.]|jgi:predicted CoA-binding protein|nr:hypothetical protein [Syntrophomonas sp.]